LKSDILSTVDNRRPFLKINPLFVCSGYIPMLMSLTC